METKREPDNTEKVVMTTCSSHCGGTCLLKLHVKDGAITRIETDDGEAPQYRACLKGRAYRQRVYAPDRLKYPMKRAGERGKGEFERISWDEALDTVASEIKRVKNSYGPAAILSFSSVGDVTLLHNAGLMERLLTKAGGYSGPWGAASGEGAVFALLATYGAFATGNTRDDLLNSRLIILWGWNPAVTGSVGNTRLYLSQAKEAGIRIVCVDPKHTESAAVLAQQWIPIRPGTDTAMLIAMAHVMITEDLHDQTFLDKYTLGFEKFRDYILGREDGVPKTPFWAQDITGVPANTIASLAREYATIKPAALMTSFAPGRSAYGEQYHRAAITLAAMTGNIGIQGGNAPSHCLGDVLPALRLGPPVFACIVANNPVDDAFPPRKESPFYEIMFKYMPTNYYFGSPSSARVNRFNMADAILKGRSGGYPADYKLLYMVNFNYVNQYANTNKIVQALKTLECVVIQDQFMTPTAKFADILLPTNSFLERNDLTTGGIGPFYGYMNKAIDSLDESKSQFEIAAQLAPRLGVTDFNAKTEEEWLREIVARCEDIPDYEAFKKNGVHKITFDQPYVCFQNQISDPVNNPFPTPSGKIEIYSQQLADMHNPTVPPIPKYIETWESRNDPLAKKYPLQLITTHTQRRAHTQFDNIPWLRELYPQAISINTADAQKRGIKDGDMVRVFNDRGEMIIPAKVTERIMPGVVDIPQGAWYDPDKKGADRGGCANILTKDTISPGGAFASNTALVQVEKA
jgi:anaerobic dimethyl sulfoxide reductase subunit A